jgi:hypothetical protein
MLDPAAHLGGTAYTRWGIANRRSPSFAGAKQCRIRGNSRGITGNSRSVPSRNSTGGPSYLGNHVTGLAQHDGVADRHALGFHDVLVVQGRLAHHQNRRHALVFITAKG